MTSNDDSDKAPESSGGLEKNLEVSVNSQPYDAPPSEVYGFSRHVCQILMRTVKGTSAIGSGFLVGPNLALTSFHVVEKVEPHNLECRFDVRSTDIGPKIGPAYSVAEVLASSPYSIAELDSSYHIQSEVHPQANELDYALLRLDAHVGDELVEVVQGATIKRGWLELPQAVPQTDSTKYVYVLQHPGGAGIRAASGALVTAQPSSGTRLRYLANTSGGSSGSPCFQWSLETPRKLLLVAIHNYGHAGTGESTGFNQGIPVHLIRNDLDGEAPGWDDFTTAGQSDIAQSTTASRLAEIERAVLSGVTYDVLETYSLEVESILADHPSNLDTKRLQRMLSNALANEVDRRPSPVQTGIGTSHRSRGLAFFSVACSALLVVGLAGYISMQMRSNNSQTIPQSPIDDRTTTVTEPLVDNGSATSQSNQQVLHTCAITASATLSEDYGTLSAGEPLSVEAKLVHSGAMGLHEVQGEMTVRHENSGDSLRSELSFANFGDNIWNGERDVIGLNGSYLEGQIGSIVGQGTARPGIDLRGPTTAMNGKLPENSAEWNRLRQRTLMLPAPNQPGAVTGVARIGQLQVNCQSSGALMNDGAEESAAYDTATINMLNAKYAKPVSAGDNHACAVKEGAVWCWGANNRGQLGNGRDQDSATPTAVNGISTATQISAGAGRFVGSPDAHTCALLRAGEIKCWGAGTEGQLGNGSLIDAYEPVSVAGISNAIQIASGGQYSCALTSSGSVYCWGSNHSGQLGTGDNDERRTPAKVAGLESAVQLVAGKQHACAVGNDGTIKCWGANHAGQLGFGEDQTSGSGSSNVPVTVYGIGKAVWAGVAESHTCAITADQNVSCWGQNSFGALGDNSEEIATTPVNTQPR